MSKVYFDNFKSADDVRREFASDDALNDAIVHLAWYGDGSYCGDAFVLYEQAGELWMVEGYHCSCRGLEGQWEPEKTTWPTLAMFIETGKRRLLCGDYDGGNEVYDRLCELVREHAPEQRKR